MGQLMVESSAHTESSLPPPPPPPPSTHHRRPRVREVSSRFMSSPMIHSSSVDHNHNHNHSHSNSHSLTVKSPLQKLHSLPSPSPTSKFISDVQSRQRSTPNNRRRRQLDLDQPLRCSDENQSTNTGLESSVQIQGSESPISSEHSHLSESPRKQRSVKPLKENRGVRQQSTPSRPDTPTVTTSMDRTVSVPSRFRLVQQRYLNNTASAATKLLQPTPGNKVSTYENQDGTDNNNNNNNNNHTARSLPDIRNSMPEADMMPSVSSRLRAEKNGSRGGNAGNGNTSASTDSLKFSSFSCNRSLNLSSPSCDHSAYSSIESCERLGSGVIKSHVNFGKMGGVNLPPVPPCASSKLGVDIRKVKKVSGHQEDVHSLKLLYNRYLQWRFANARAEVSRQTLQRETERAFCSLSLNILELYDSVVKKRIELKTLKRAKTLSTILYSQIPHLDQWPVLEEDYSVSLAETVQALTNASLRLPISGNVRADVKEISEALNSAAKLMEVIGSHVEQFVPKAEETETLISELARISGGEKALIEECGDLLSNTYTSQVDEWSLRSQIIQFHR